MGVYAGRQWIKAATDLNEIPGIIGTIPNYRITEPVRELLKKYAEYKRLLKELNLIQPRTAEKDISEAIKILDQILALLKVNSNIVDNQKQTIEDFKAEKERLHKSYDKKRRVLDTDPDDKLYRRAK